MGTAQSGFLFVIHEPPKAAMAAAISTAAVDLSVGLQLVDG